jgi:large subunit ribosomal protein L12
MEYVYAAMLLHKAGKEITEDAVKAVLSATGVSVDDARVKALVAALQGVNIEEAIKKAAVAAPAAAPTATAAPAAEEKKDEKPKEDDKKAEESAAAGLGALFG